MHIEDIANLLIKHSEFNIFTHIDPDGDGLGSCFALKYALEALGKRVRVILPSPLPRMYSFTGWQPVVYTHDMSISGVAISLDSSDVERLGIVHELYFSVPTTYNIDHHKTNTEFAKINYVEKDSSSTGEIIYKLITAMGVAFDKSIAQAVYIAILTDTGGFKYSNTTSFTHYATGKLLESGIDMAYINRKIYETQPLRRLHLQAEAIKRIELFANGKLALITMPCELLESYDATEDDTDGLSTIPRSIESVEVGVLLKEYAKGKVKLSLRSNEYIDVAEVALGFGGGGHKRAAGCTIHASLDAAKQQIVEAVEKLIKD